MTLFKVLKNDHQEIAMLLNEANENLTKSNKDAALWLDLKRKLQAHTRMEEMFFYPVIAKVDETRALTLAAYEDHNPIDQLLQEFDNIAVTDDLWIAKFMALKENIEHHIAEEEQKLFPKVEHTLAKEKIAQISKEMEQFKKAHS